MEWFRDLVKLQTPISLKHHDSVAGDCAKSSLEKGQENDCTLLSSEK